MRKMPSKDTLEKTEILLDFVKDAFQMFSYTKGDRKKILTWAEGLEPVIDWTVDGVLDYIQDNGSARKKNPPSLADVYDYAEKAKRKAQAEEDAEAWAELDPESLSSYVSLNKEISREEMYENQKYQAPKLNALFAEFYRDSPELRRWTAINGKKPHHIDLGGGSP